MSEFDRRLRPPLRAAGLALLLLAGTANLHAAGAVHDPSPTPNESPPPLKKKYSVVPSDQQIDINRASREQLKTLPGIGEAEAGKIIAGRPYASKADLVSRQVLPEGLYISIRYRIKAVPVENKPSKK